MRLERATKKAINLTLVILVAASGLLGAADEVFLRVGVWILAVAILWGFTQDHLFPPHAD